MHTERKGGRLIDVPDEDIYIPEMVQQKIEEFLEKMTVLSKDGEPLVGVMHLREILIIEYHGSHYQLNRFGFKKYAVSDLRDPYKELGYKKGSVFFSKDDARKALNKIYFAGRIDFSKMQEIIERTNPIETRLASIKEPIGEAALSTIKEAYTAIVPESGEAEKNWQTERSFTSIRIHAPEHVSSIAMQCFHLDKLLEVLSKKLNAKTFGVKSSTTTITDVGVVRYADEQTAGLFVSLGEDETIRFSKSRTFYLFIKAVDKKKAEIRIEMMSEGSDQGKINKDPDRQLFWGAIDELAEYVVKKAAEPDATKTKYAVPVLEPDSFK